LGVGREGEDPRIACKQAGRAIPLEHIQIPHQDPLYQPFCEQHVGGHGHIIENAEATAHISEGMMCASGQVAGQTVLQS
jgi:hypothetical protein